MPKNQWYKKMQINQRVEREKEIMKPNFNVENFQRDKKPQAYNWSKNVHYEEQKLNTRFYLAEAYQSFPDHLTSTFSFQFLTFFF